MSQKKRSRLLPFLTAVAGGTIGLLAFLCVNSDRGPTSAPRRTPRTSVELRTTIPSPKGEDVRVSSGEVATALPAATDPAPRIQAPCLNPRAAEQAAALADLTARRPNLEAAKAEDGSVSFLMGELSDASALPPVERAKAFLKENAALWGIADVDRDLALDPSGTATAPDEYGVSHVRFHQVVSGVALLRHDLRVHMDANGVVLSVDGEVDPQSIGAGVDPTPSVAVERAVEVVKQDAAARLAKAPSSTLASWRGDDGVHLVWAIGASSVEGCFSREYIVDAHSAAILSRQDMAASEEGVGVTPRGLEVPLQVTAGQDGAWHLVDESRDAWIGTFSLYYFESQEATDFHSIADQLQVEWASPSDDGTYVQSWQQSDAAAHYNMGKTLDYWATYMGRASWDNQNGAVLDAVHMHTNGSPNNAFSFMDGVHVFGDGDGKLLSSLTSIDVVAHEFGHTVFQSCSNLDMSKHDSGTLQEHVADIWGTFVERRMRNEHGRYDWFEGEEVMANGAHALRDLSDPTSVGDPTHFSQYTAKTEIHAGSEIMSNAVYLWVHGGVNRKSRVRVTGMQPQMGEERAFRTAELSYYRAMLRYVPHTPTLSTFRLAVLSAVRDVAGQKSVAYNEAVKAYQAIGLK